MLRIGIWNVINSERFYDYTIIPFNQLAYFECVDSSLYKKLIVYKLRKSLEKHERILCYYIKYKICSGDAKVVLSDEEDIHDEFFNLWEKYIESINDICYEKALSYLHMLSLFDEESVGLYKFKNMINDIYKGCININDLYSKSPIIHVLHKYRDVRWWEEKAVTYLLDDINIMDRNISVLSHNIKSVIRGINELFSKYVRSDMNGRFQLMCAYYYGLSCHWNRNMHYDLALMASHKAMEAYLVFSALESNVAVVIGGRIVVLDQDEKKPLVLRIYDALVSNQIWTDEISREHIDVINRSRNMLKYTHSMYSINGKEASGAIDKTRAIIFKDPIMKEIKGIADSLSRPVIVNPVEIIECEDNYELYYDKI